MYDWANSAFVTTIITAVFPIYFASVAAADIPRPLATARFAAASTVALLVVAGLSPVAGVVADLWPIKKKMLGAFLGVGVLSTALMALLGRGDQALALALFVTGNIGLFGSFVFYDALLPHIARDDEVDRVSSAGYALGYLGGGLLLALNLLWIERPGWFGLRDGAAASRLSFLSVAVWWLAFSIPLLRRVPEPPVAPPLPRSRRGGPVRLSLRRLLDTGRALRAYPQASLLLVAFVLYNDGIGTIYRVASIYGTEIGLTEGALVLSLLITQFVSIPFAFLFGALADRIGAKRAILLSLFVYVLISVLGYFMKTEKEFLALALLVAMVQGGSQSLSRSLFATLIPRDSAGQFFSFFGLFDKVSGVLGPLVFAAVGRAFGSSRYGILSIVFFFVAGAILLAFVDVPEGQRAARGRP